MCAIHDNESSQVLKTCSSLVWNQYHYVPMNKHVNVSEACVFITLGRKCYCLISH